jgi:hypothetical protein
LPRIILSPPLVPSDDVAVGQPASLVGVAQPLVGMTLCIPPSLYRFAAPGDGLWLYPAVGLDASGVGHPVQPLPDVRRSDASSA